MNYFSRIVRQRAVIDALTSLCRKGFYNEIRLFSSKMKFNREDILRHCAVYLDAKFL